MNLILNKLPIPVYINDPHTQKVSYINDAAMKLFEIENYSTAADFVKAEDVDIHAQVDNYVLTTGNEYMANETLRLINGKEFETFVRKLAMEINGQRQILVLRMDLTEQRKAEMTNKIISASLPS